jgi:Flp pilus assembly protein TadD
MPDDSWEILASRPLDIDTCRRHVCTVQASGDTDESAAAWLALANALFFHGEYRQATFAYGQALACRPRSVPALKGMSMAHLALGDADPAVRYLSTAITAAPDHAEIHALLGYAYHLSGDADRGWDAVGSAHRLRGRTGRPHCGGMSSLRANSADSADARR